MSKKIINILFLLAVFTTASAKLSVQLDSAHAQLGEPFRLILIDDNPHAHTRPDLTPLQKNFTLVGSQQMSNYTVINGQARSMIQWVLLLVPKRTGTLIIPPITIGQSATKKTQIEVSQDGNTSDGTVWQQQDNKAPPVKFKTEVSETKPYVNQQVIYTVKLYMSRRLLDADYEPPQVKDALMVSLGNPRRYQTSEHGISYMVQELQYAFFPQKSGALTITPPRFRALVFDATPENIQIRAKTTLLQVQPAKVSNQKINWLPAKQVTLQETYDNQSLNIEQGTMIIRTVTLSVTGAAAQLLPKLVFETNQQFSVYPETPTEETHYQKPDLKGVVVTKVTYLFNQSGHIVIPELKLPWFNTIRGEFEVTSLPARTIRVSPSPVTKPEISNSPTTINPASPTGAEKPSIPAQSSVSHAIITQSWVAWGVAIGFAVVWLITLLLWWWTRTPRTGNTIQQARKRVLLACRCHDPYATKEALIDWARKVWPDTPCFHLGEVERLVSVSDLKKAINTLSQQLYQDQKQTWQGTELARSFAVYKPEKMKRQKKEKNPLPPINP